MQDARHFLKVILGLIKQGSQDVKVRELAIAITRTAPDDREKARRIFEYVKKQIAYTRDPVKLEDMQTARRTLTLRAGDCDDFTVLIGSLLESIGIPSAAHLVRTKPAGEFNHIYPAAKIRGAEISLDVAAPRPVFDKLTFRTFKAMRAER